MSDRPYSVDGDWSGRLVSVAVHAGHDLRPEVAAAMVLDEETRLREEDPSTDLVAAGAPARVVVHRSRFEVDLNRPREGAVYRRPEDCWGLRVWRADRLDEGLVRRSVAVYDAFYADLADRLDGLAARGPFVVYDVHSYNHRVGADGAPEDVSGNPEVNLGTGTVDPRFRPVVDALRDTLSAQEVQGHRLDVRENVRFRGRALAWWVHGRYPGRGVCLSLDLRKSLLTPPAGPGVVDPAHPGRLREALAATHAPVLEALRRLDRGRPHREG